MKRSLLAFFALAAAFGGLASSPIVSNVTIDPASDRIFSNSFFAYDLSGAPGIVTFYLETNGVPVDCPYVHVSGDMNRLLQPGRHTFRWRNDLDWPGHAIRTPDCRLVVKAWATNSPPDYLIYNLKTPSEAPRYYAKATDVPDGVTATKYKIDHLVMRRIHAAGQTYLMGTPPNDPAYAAATAPHEVAFTKDFYIGIYELTFGQMLTVKSSGNTAITAYYNVYGKENLTTYNSTLMDEVRKTTDLHYSRAAAMTQYKYYWFGTGFVFPASGKSCFSSGYMQAFRNATQNETMFLPTSYQWEFACRAGCGARLYNGSNSTNATATADVGELGWFTLNNSQDPDWFKISGQNLYLPHVVGLKTPNAWGLYDMLGNVAEICADVYASSPVINADGTPIVDPSGPVVATNTDPLHPVCGGNLYQTATSLCAGQQASLATGSGQLYTGFRLVCDVEVSR